MIKFNQVKSATIAATNENDESRVLNIFADVTYTDGKVTRIEHGRAVAMNEEKTEKATFSSWGEGNVSFNINNAESGEESSIFAEVKGFIDELRNADAQPTVSLA